MKLFDYCRMREGRRNSALDKKDEHSSVFLQSAKCDVSRHKMNF